MTTYFISRHSGAIEWAAEKGLQIDQQCNHLDITIIKPGDIVIGTLPTHLAAEVCQRGGRYLHLTLELPPEQRGRGLSKEEMHKHNARIEGFRIQKIEAGRAAPMNKKQNARNKNINHNIRTILAITLPMILVITIGWISDYIKGDAIFPWLTGQDVYLRSLLTLVLLGITVSIAEWIYNHRRTYLPIQTLSKKISAPKSCLIILVSPPNLRIELNAKLSLEASIKQLSDSGIRWNWEQLLRGVDAHTKAPLKQIYLIGSEGNRGSQEHLDQCEAMLKHRLPSDTMIEKSLTGIDFEDLDELTNTLHSAIQHLKSHNFQETDICIDATGGQKTTSISAALVTLTSKVTFQYVQTSGDKKVISYDVISTSAPSLE